MWIGRRSPTVSFSGDNTGTIVTTMTSRTYRAISLDQSPELTTTTATMAVRLDGEAPDMTTIAQSRVTPRLHILRRL